MGFWKRLGRAVEGVAAIALTGKAAKDAIARDVEARRAEKKAEAEKTPPERRTP